MYETFGEDFVIKWKIQNSRACSKQNGFTLLKSPPVTSKSLFHSEWTLMLCLGGDYASSEEHAACYLNRCFPRHPTEIEIYCNLSVNGHQISGQHTFKPFTAWKKSDFPIVNSKLDHDDLLEVECRMSRATPRPDTDPPLNESTSNCYEQYCIQSRILEEKASFDFSITDADLKTLEKKQLPKIKFFTGECELSPTLQLKNTEDEAIYLEADFSLEKCNLAEVSGKSIFASVFIHILNSLGKLSNTTEFRHIFGDEVNSNWNFTHQLRKRNINSNHNSEYLRLEISVSKGELLSDVDYCPEYLASRDSPVSFSKEILRFYEEKKFCDVSLRTEDKSFECHKVVLCAISPVFANLLAEGTKRSNPCIIQIKDMDSQTVDQVINFIYTGKVRELDFETAKSLFLAAVAYQIYSLKLICCDFLKKNLNHENVCEVLCFAKEYNENSLKFSAVGYIGNHRNEILRSPQWKDLENKDIHLAFETINSFIHIQK